LPTTAFRFRWPRVVRSPAEAAAAFKQLGHPVCVVKAQVYAGGRGKAGFVKLVKSADEAMEAAKFMLSHRMVSPQTGPEGVPVSLLIVAPGVGDRQGILPGHDGGPRPRHPRP